MLPRFSPATHAIGFIVLMLSVAWVWLNTHLRIVEDYPWEDDL